MTSYAISKENTITAYDREPADQSATVVRSYDELYRAAQSWPGQRLVELWNYVAASSGASPVRKFENRTVGAQRLWRALQSLPVVDAPRRSKKQVVFDLVQRSSGASLEELMTATGWRAHSVRGYISTHRAEYGIERFRREEGEYAYRATKTDG